MRAVAAGVVLTVGLLAGCSSSGHAAVQYGTPPATIAKQLGICNNPEPVTKGSVRCRFSDGHIVAVDNVGGPADQQGLVEAEKGGNFCALVGHGFEVVAIGYSDLKKYGHANAVVSKYGGKVVGAC